MKLFKSLKTKAEIQKMDNSQLKQIIGGTDTAAKPAPAEKERGITINTSHVE